MKQEKTGILDTIIDDLYLFIPTCILNESVGLDRWEVKTCEVYKHIKRLKEIKEILSKAVKKTKLSKSDKKAIKKFLGI